MIAEMGIVTIRSGYWNKNVRPNWSLTSSLDTVIRQLELMHADLLPQISTAPTLIMTSDYGGQHKGATHETFSFLVADLQRCERWNEERQKVRDLFLKNQRRMSYKSLNDHQRRTALIPFLDAADGIPGLLATVLINKKLGNSLKLTAEERARMPTSIASWPDHVIQKMTFVAHLGALLIAGLSGSRQNILWLTDNDDFVANDQRVIDLTPLFAGIISQYAGHDLGHFRFGTMNCDAGDLQIEDLAAIPDLVSGATCEIPLGVPLNVQSNVKVPLRDCVSAKALTLLHWMGRRDVALKRLLVVADEGDSPNKVRTKALELFPE